MQELEKEVKNKALTYTDVDWNNLLFSIKEHETRLLELVYCDPNDEEPKPKSVTYKQIYHIYKGLNLSARTARRTIKKLSKEGLIGNIVSVIGFVNPIRELTNNIKLLIKMFNEKKRLGNQRASFVDYEKLIEGVFK